MLEKARDTYPNFNWSDYDNRNNYPNYDSDNSLSSPDSEIDYVIIVYRYDKSWSSQPSSGSGFKKGVPGGYSTIGNFNNINWNGYNFTAGFTSCMGHTSASGFAKFFVHELAHELYECPHVMGANSTMGMYFNKPYSGWGMMGTGGRVLAANAWESWLLGWNELETGSNSENSDIQSAADLNASGEYNLRDFVTNGDAIRIKIPNTTSTYLWIENHQKQSMFDHCPWAGSKPGRGAELIPDIESGLYMYIENTWPTRNNFNLSPFNMSAVNSMKLLNAQGNYDYTHSPMPEMNGNYFDGGYYWGNKVYSWERGSKINIGGINPWYSVIDDYPKFDDNKMLISGKDGHIPWTDNDHNGSKIERQAIVRETKGANTNMLFTNTFGLNNEAVSTFGRRSDAFQLGDKVGIDGIVPALNHPEYSTANSKLGEAYLNGLSVEVIGDANGVMRIKIKFNDYNIIENKRWTGNISIPDLTNNSNYDLVIGTNTNVYVDKSGIPNRHTQLNGEFVNPSVLTCMPNASVLIRSAAELKIENKSTLALSNNSTVTIESGILSISNNSHLLVKSGICNIVNNGTININGNLSFEPGAQLIVTGTGEFNFNGTIIASGGGTLTLKGSNYIKLTGNINAAPNASLTIEGSSKNTKLIEVDGNPAFNSNFNSITIKNGKIQVNNRYDALEIKNGVNNVLIDNVLVTGPSKVMNSGLSIKTDGNITVKNSTFTNCYTALGIWHNARSHVVNVKNCTFTNNHTGIIVYNGGINIDNCTIEHNTAGIRLYSMDQPCSITKNTVKYHTYACGIQYSGSSAAKLTLKNNGITNNDRGVLLSGNFVCVLKCNGINHNTDFGIHSDNADIYLASYSGISAGQNSLYNNKYAIKLSGSTSYFYLNYGVNDLRSDTYCIKGTVGQITGGIVNANRNIWKRGGGSPIKNTNYILSGSSSSIILRDNYPVKHYYACRGPEPIGKPSAAAPSGESFREVNSSLGTMPLNESVNTILNDDVSTGNVYDTETQTELLGEVLMNDFSNANTGEEWYVHHAYNMYKSAATVNISSSQKSGSNKAVHNLEIIRKLEKDQNNKKTRKVNYSDERFTLNIDEANALWFNAKYDQALNLLQILQKKVKGDQYCQVQKMICQINADRAFVESNNNINIEELLAACDECDESSKLGTINSANNRTNKTGSLGNILFGELTLSVMPHPVNNSSKIQLIGLQQTGKITIYNSMGTIVFSEEINTGIYSHEVSNNEYTPGIYLVAIDVNGSIAKTIKMVVSE